METEERTENFDVNDSCGPIRNRVLYRRVEKGGRDEWLVLIVPRQLRGNVRNLSHNNPSSGHMGMNRCLKRCSASIIGQVWYLNYNSGLLSANCAITGNLKSLLREHLSKASLFQNQWNCGPWTSWVHYQ